MEALDGVNFTIRKGEVFGLVGESGCGKSVTALSILQLVPPPGRVISGEAYLDGENVNKVRFHDHGYIVIGNESNGIDPILNDLIDYRIAIPRYGGAESLNAGIATAIICDNLMRSTTGF